MAHHPCIGWVRVGGAWAFCVLHFHVCSWLVCYSCVCHDLSACLHVLLLILDLLWCGWVSGLSFFMSYFFPRLGLAWSWAFPSLIQPLTSLRAVWHFCHVIIWLVLVGPPLGLLYAFLLVNSSSLVLSLGLYSCCFGLPWPISSLLSSLGPFYSLGILGPFHFLGHPWPIPILHSYGLLLSLLGFPGLSYHILYFRNL